MVPLVEIVAVEAGTNVGIVHVLDIIYATTQYTTEDSSVDEL